MIWVAAYKRVCKYDWTRMVVKESTQITLNPRPVQLLWRVKSPRDRQMGFLLGIAFQICRQKTVRIQ